VAWALRTLFDPARSPLSAPPGRWAAVALAAALGELPELLAGARTHRAWWEGEERAYRAGVAALRGGAIEVREDEEASLARVGAHAPVAAGLAPFCRVGHGTALPVHPGALHSVLAAPRVLVSVGDQIAYYDRYETWVRFRSRHLARRRDLGPLALVLTAAEPAGVRWRADPPAALVPVLAPVGGTSGLGHERVAALVREHLLSAPAAWEPDRPAGESPGAASGPAAPRGGTSGRGLARWRGPRRATPSA
jgi:hypothetical protein